MWIVIVGVKGDVVPGNLGARSVPAAYCKRAPVCSHLALVKVCKELLGRRLLSLLLGDDGMVVVHTEMKVEKHHTGAVAEEAALRPPKPVH